MGSPRIYQHYISAVAPGACDQTAAQRWQDDETRVLASPAVLPSFVLRLASLLAPAPFRALVGRVPPKACGALMLASVWA